MISEPHAQFPFSLTVETQDRAVLFCLRGLCANVEQDADWATALAEASVDAWTKAEGCVTFRFSAPRHRSAFLGDATRLLAGKWMRVALHDDEPMN